MGSFSELTLALSFTADTPVEIIGAFAEWRTDDQGSALPTLEESLGHEEVRRLDLHLSDWITDDLVLPLPPLHRAVGWRSITRWGDNAYFAGTPQCALRWDPYSEWWTLSLRTIPKMAAEEIQALVAPLGAFAGEGAPDDPRFVGYVDDEHRSRPVLVWSTGAVPFQFEYLGVEV
jgi:hypothetical protein